MKKPLKQSWGSKVFWDRGTTYIIEYAVWEHGGPIRMMDLCRKVKREYLPNAHVSNLASKITAMVERGILRKLARGVYMHPQLYDLLN